MHHWHRLLQERVLQTPKRILLGASSMMPWVQTRLNSYLACLVSRWPVCGLVAMFKEEQIPIATMKMHQRQYCTNWDSLVSIHMLIWGLDSPGVISRTCSPTGLLTIRPMQKSKTVETNSGQLWPGWSHTVVSAAVPDMLEIQNELELKAAKWHTTIYVASEFLIPVAAECNSLSAAGVSSTPGINCPRVETQPYHL